MMNVAQISQFLHDNPRMVLVDVDTFDDTSLVLRLISNEFDGWHNTIVVTYARIHDGKIAYRRDGNKSFAPRLYFTREYYTKNGVEFVTKKARKIVSSFLGGKDLFETVTDMEAVIAQKQQESKERRLRKLETAMQVYFDTPVVSMDDVQNRAREVTPKYMVVKNHVGWCSSCGNENPVTVLSGKHMTCPSCGRIVRTVYTKNVKHDRDGSAYRYDSFWVMASDVRKTPDSSIVTSYFLCINKVDLENRSAELTCTEEARKIEREGKQDERWCKSGKEWNKTVVPHFVQYGMGGYYYGDRAMWCERGYVIPDQHVRFLHKFAPKTKSLPLDVFYVNDTADTWNLDCHSVRSSSEFDGSAVCKKLVANGINEIARMVMLSSAYGINDQLNVSARSMRKILKLTDSQYEDFMASDRSYDSLTIIKKAGSKLFDVPPLDKYRKLVLEAVPKKGLDAGNTFLVPVRKADFITYYKFGVQVLPGGRLKESLLYCDGNPVGRGAHEMYRLIGNRFYPYHRYGSYEDCGCVLLREDFDSFADKDFWKDLQINRIPVEMLRRNDARIGFMNNYSAKVEPSVYLPVYERFMKAGFTKLTNSISNLVFNGICPGDRSCNFIVRKYAQQVCERSVKGDKLYKVFDIPRNIMRDMDRSSATWSTLLTLQKFCEMYPSSTWEDFKVFSAVPNGIVKKTNEYNLYDLTVNKQPYRRTFDYLIKNKIHAHEYVDYLDILKRMHIPIVSDNVFPNDFQTTYVKMSAAYTQAKDSLNKEAMIRIRDALMSDKKVRKYLKSNTKYLVFVPESPEELVQESKRLHNCLSTYIDKVARGNTSVFFIRDADNPDAALYAMEVMDGKLIQLHGVNNCCLVRDDPAAVFARGFVSVLRNINFNPKEILQAA